MEPEPEPQPPPARRAESRAEGKARTKMQGLSARLEACTPPAAAEGAKQSKKGRKGQKPSSRPPPLSAQEAKQWLEAVSAASTLALPTTSSDGLEAAAAGADGEQAPWAAEYFALLQRVAQSGPLAGAKPGRFRKAKPPRDHAEAAVACLSSAVEADRAAAGRLLTEPQRTAIADWLRDAERYFEKTADGRPPNTATTAGAAAAANPAHEQGDRELAALAEGASGEGSSAAAAAERLRGNVAATMRTDGRKPRW